MDSSEAIEALKKLGLIREVKTKKTYKRKDGSIHTSHSTHIAVKRPRKRKYNVSEMKAEYLKACDETDKSRGRIIKELAEKYGVTRRAIQYELQIKKSI
jgi:hypothetical protein